MLKTFKRSLLVLTVTVLGLILNWILVSSAEQKQVALYKAERTIFLEEMGGINFNDIDSLARMLTHFEKTTIHAWVVNDSLGQRLASGGVPLDVTDSDLLKRTINVQPTKELWGDSPEQNDGESVVAYIRLKEPDSLVEYTFIIINFIVCSFLIFILSYWQIINVLDKYKNAKTKNEDQSDVVAELEEKNSKLADTIREDRQSKSMFVADLCHELRTPISTLFTMNDLMADENKKKKFGHVFDANRAMLDGLLTDFINLAKDDVSKFTNTPVQCDIVAVVEEAIKICTADTTKNYEVVLTMSHPSVSCFIDKSRVIQIVVNLVTNALKYGGRFAHVNVNVDPNYEYPLNISVRDYGQGITRDKREKIFDAFERTTDAEAQYEGIGLGLHIANALVRNIGGTIEYKDGVPRGALFDVKLKCKLKITKERLFTGDRGRVAVIASSNSIGLATLQGVSKEYSVDIFSDVEDFKRLIAKRDVQFDAIVHHNLEDYNVAEITEYTSSKMVDVSRGKVKHSYMNGSLSSNILSGSLIRQMLGTISNSPSPSRNVLFLDDNHDNYSLIRFIPGGDNTVHCVDNIFDAVNYTSAFVYDCIFVDLKLIADEIGYDFINRLKMYGKNKESRVILCTANPLESLRDVSRLLGSDGLLDKPIPQDVRMDELFEGESRLITMIEKVEIPRFLEMGEVEGFRNIAGLERAMREYLARPDENRRNAFDELFNYILRIKSANDKRKALARSVERFRLLTSAGG